MTRVPFLLVVALVLAGPAFAQAPPGPCKVVFDAMLKETTTPHHIVTTRPGAAPAEAIATSDAMFVKTGGVWKKSPLRMQAMLELQQENIRGAKSTACTALPDDVVNGTPATVWHAHYEDADLGVSESKVWISKATGLPLRTDVSVQAGQKTSVVSVFDYDHIMAPAVK